MNPEIAKLYKWSVRPDKTVIASTGPGYRRFSWRATGPQPSSLDATFPLRADAINYATDQARKSAGQRVLMALMLAAVQGAKTLG